MQIFGSGNMTLVQTVRIFKPDQWEQCGSQGKANKNTPDSKKATACPAFTKKSWWATGNCNINIQKRKAVK